MTITNISRTDRAIHHFIEYASVAHPIIARVFQRLVTKKVVIAPSLPPVLETVILQIQGRIPRKKFTGARLELAKGSSSTIYQTQHNVILVQNRSAPAVSAAEYAKGKRIYQITKVAKKDPTDKVTVLVNDLGLICDENGDPIMAMPSPEQMESA